MKRILLAAYVVVLFAVLPLPLKAQSGLYLPGAKPVRDMQKALSTASDFYLLINFNGNDAVYSVAALDLLDSAFRIAFDRENPHLYTMNIEGYGGNDEYLTRQRVDAVYRYFAQRCRSSFPIREAFNPIHCSCTGDTVETIRFEVPVSTAIYDCAQLPDARKLLNKTISLRNSVLVTFHDDPDACVGSVRGCYIPGQDTVIRGYYSSLTIPRGVVRTISNTKDTCPMSLSIEVEDHLDYRSIVERYNIIPHPKHLIIQAGYIVLKSNAAVSPDSCVEKLKDSITLRIPCTQEQLDAKLRFFAKVKGSKGMEYKALSTRKTPGKGSLSMQANINISQLDTVYLGLRIQPSDVKDYFYPVAGPAEAAAFEVDGRYYVAYRVGRQGRYEMKKALRQLFRITPEQEEEEASPRDTRKAPNPEEIIED